MKVNVYLLKRIVLKIGAAIIVELVRVVDQQAKAAKRG